MRQFPVFVPYGEDFLSAVVTLPEEEPAGLVLLATGTGAPRSHRFQLWARVAARLTDAGLASVRMDYLGIGDSTGRIEERHMSSLELRTKEAMAVARFTLDATGVEHLAVMGNCSGGLVVLGAAARMPECIGAVCILPRLLQPTSVNRMVIGMRGSKVASLVRSTPFLRRLLSPLKGRKGKLREAVRDAFLALLGRGRLLFVYSEDDTDAYNEQSLAKIDQMLAKLPADRRDAFDLQVLKEGPLSGFESLEVQRRVVELSAEWLASCFGRRLPEAAGLERSPVPAP
jgi:pimeloyl-ACP methyl ester carboxylesterase